MSCAVDLLSYLMSCAVDLLSYLMSCAVDLLSYLMSCAVDLLSYLMSHQIKGRTLEKHRAHVKLLKPSPLMTRRTDRLTDRC